MRVISTKGHRLWNCPLDKEKPQKNFKHDSDIITLFVRKSTLAGSKIKEEANFHVQLCT